MASSLACKMLLQPGGQLAVGDPVEIGSEGRTQELNRAGSRQMAGKTFLVYFLEGEIGQ